MVFPDLLARHAGAELAQDQLDRDPRALDRGLAGHDPWINDDPLVPAGFVNHVPSRALVPTIALL
jgi:hypothetical protein